MSDLKEKIVDAIDEYLEATEAWDDALLAIAIDGKEVYLVEEEEAVDDDGVDLYDIMDFIEMTPDGEWIRDDQAIDSVVEDYE
ncbi:MAG: hypothetical protein SOV24_03260 [Muribaculaceae bacterium]|nr:hypothetical protein [Bacteroidales bacterium]MDY2733365.1 hypothetical protein [Muribaculaceae bacterium]MDY4649169.1 hypothetical protein [Muribaculaceae bacterium]